MRTIKIINLNCKPVVNGLTDVVESILFQVTDTTTINAETHTVKGSTIVRLADPNADEFVAFSSLTEAQVIGWITANSDIDRFVTRLIGIENNRLNPPVVTLSPPWNS